MRIRKLVTIGEKYNRLTVIASLPVKEVGDRHIVLKCECGNITYQRIDQVRKGLVQSCGCLHKETAHAQGLKNLKHGGTRRLVPKLPEYNIYCKMLARCYNPNDKKYYCYGGRGIKVCDRWLGEHGFENFILDMGYRPSPKYSLDRWPNVNGNYELGNVQWSTQKEQQNHKRNNIHSENKPEHMWWRKNLSDAVRHFLFSDSKRSQYLRYIGCSSEEFKKHFESLFLPGMTWDNYGKGEGKWQVDHIWPCYKYDLSKEEDRLKCFHFSNMRPWWAKDNLSFVVD